MTFRPSFFADALDIAYAGIPQAPRVSAPLSAEAVARVERLGLSVEKAAARHRMIAQNDADNRFMADARSDDEQRDRLYAILARDIGGAK